MAFHGHTKIELHNVKTGEDKVIEKHNIFTNYLHDVMQIVPTPRPTNWMGCAKGSSRYGTVQFNNQNGANGGLPSTTDLLCGGILCLANEHTESADNYFLTGDDVVTARGANIANASEDTQLGSYNVPLEKLSDTSKTMVWDFAQNQGNGTISTIGLTNIGMALCGLGGIPSSIEHTNTNSFGDVCFVKDFVTETQGYYDDDYPSTDPCYDMPIYLSLERGKLVSFLGLESKILHLRYYDLNNNIINPMCAGSGRANTGAILHKSCGVDYTGGKVYRYSPTKRVQFDLSSYNFAGFSYLNMLVTNDGFLYVSPQSGYQWQPNATITFVKIDLMNEKIVGTHQLTNTTGVVLNLSTFSSLGKTSQTGGEAHFYNCPVFDKYVLFRGDNGKRTFAINMENSTDVKEIFTEEGDSFRIGRYIMDFAGGMLCTASGNEDKNALPAYIVDPKRGTACRVRTGSLMYEYWVFNGWTVRQENWVQRVPSDSKLLNFWTYIYSSYIKHTSPSAILMAYKQDALTTINVLDEPVIKTADMTMRITYTISLEE